MKIIFIDDDEASHTYHGLMASDAGIDKKFISHFYYVDDTIKYLKDLIQNENSEEWPCNIFIDINMPMKSGYDFVQEYSELNHPFPNPCIIFVSSTRNEKDLEKIKSFPLVQDIKEKFLETEYFQTLKAEKCL